MDGLAWWIAGILLLLLVGSHIWFYQRVLHPLKRLAGQAEQLTAGELDSFDKDCGGVDEIRQLQRAMAGMVGHLRRDQDHIRAYTDTLTDSLEHERKRIARELHDDTVQSVIAVIQSIDLTKNWLESDPERAKQMMNMAREQATEIVTSLRELIGGLRPPALEELGLVSAVEMLVAKSEQVTVTFSVSGAVRRLEEAHELTLFRIVQEGLNNTVKHGEASRLTIQLTYGADDVELRLSDDGRGFVPPQDLRQFTAKRHYGLLGVQERVTALDGTFEIISGIGQGTVLLVRLPLDGSHQPDHLVRDPVCSGLIEPQKAYGSSLYQGETYYFCCPVCQGAFQKEPERYV
jgi:signal transduction histidine kinase/YHS domain-containing protein